MLLVNENISVSGITVLHADDGLVGVLHGVSLDPSLDVVVTGELQALGYILRRTNEGSSDVYVA